MTIRPNILITGASGFIGGHIVRHFAEKDINVFCLVRENSKLDFINDLPVHFIEGDITNLASLIIAFKGKDFIIHTAARSKDWGKWDAFYQANVTGTLNVLRAARENGINNVIITGSISSYGEENSDKIKDENSPENPHYPYFLNRVFPSGMNYYRDSKTMATLQSMAYAAENQINLTVIEPVWVYGENEFSSGFYEYLKTVKSGMRIMPGSRKNNFHVVYAGDLAEAYYRVFELKLSGLNRIIIGNELPDKMYRIFNLFCKEAGLKQPVRVSRAMIYPVAFLLELTLHILSPNKPALLSRARVNMFYDNIGYDTGKAKRLIQFKANTPLEKGVSKTVNWYKQHQYL